MRVTAAIARYGEASLRGAATRQAAEPDSAITDRPNGIQSAGAWLNANRRRR